jgi:hypothetical protein
MELHHGKTAIVNVKKAYICGKNDESEKEKKLAADIRKIPSSISHVCLK